MRAVNPIIETWSEGREAGADDKAAHVRAVARAEFGRRGYEATTIRDIAFAAGFGIGTVHRLIGSKEELLASIMRSFGRKVAAGWISVLRSHATPIEQLDALAWVDINVLDRFQDEFRIQLAWMRQSPPDTPNPGWSFLTRLRQLRTLLNQGIRSGEIRIECPSGALRARRALDPGEHPARDGTACSVDPRARHGIAWSRRTASAFGSGLRRVSAAAQSAGLAPLGLLASAISGRALEVGAGEPDAPAWTDGKAIFVDPDATPRRQLEALAVQAALLAAGSLAPDVVRRLARRKALARRYLAVEGHRALAAARELLPPSLGSLLDPAVAARTG